MEIGVLQTAGFVLSRSGQVIGFVAQLQMKDSWRLGIDKHAEMDLVTAGLFKFSRNPICLCLVLSLLGFLFIAPNLLSIICCVVMLYGVNEKVKDEDEFLNDKFGDEFLRYQSKVRRWI